jgi:DNA-binding CsgD family transcriptional regulator
VRRALDLAGRYHAAPLADQARQELTAAGARPRRAISGVDALTPSELRVARMAAEGMGNRAIAQALFVTVKTIEVHLGSAYRKLGVPSRAALAGALADDRHPARASGQVAMTIASQHAKLANCHPILRASVGRIPAADLSAMPGRPREGKPG